MDWTWELLSTEHWLPARCGLCAARAPRAVHGPARCDVCAGSPRRGGSPWRIDRWRSDYTGAALTYAGSTPPPVAFPNIAPLTTDLFLQAAAAFAPEIGTERAEVDAVSFNAVVLDILDSGKYARSFDTPAHFAGWLRGWLTNARRKAQRRPREKVYAEGDGDIMSRVAITLQSEKAWTPPRRVHSYILVCPFCRSHGGTEIRDPQIPKRRGNERQTWYQAWWKVKRVENRHALTGSHPSLPHARRNTCLLCGLGFAGGTDGAQIGRDPSVVPIVKAEQPSKLKHRPPPDLDTLRKRMLPAPEILPYKGDSPAGELRHWERWLDRYDLRLLESQSRWLGAAPLGDWSGSVLNNPLAGPDYAAAIGVRNRGDRMTALRLAKETVEDALLEACVTSGLTVRQRVEREYRAGVRTLTKALRKVDAEAKPMAARLAALEGDPASKIWISQILKPSERTARRREAAQLAAQNRRDGTHWRRSRRDELPGTDAAWECAHLGDQLGYMFADHENITAALAELLAEQRTWRAESRASSAFLEPFPAVAKHAEEGSTNGCEDKQQSADAHARA